MRQDAPGRPTPVVEGLLVILGLTVLACAVTYPLARRMTSALPNDLGDPLLNTWILAWDAGRLGHFFQGVWDAPIFFPYRLTLAYSEHLLGIAVFSAPIQWLTGNSVLTYNVVFLVSFVLAGSGMYLLARTLTGRRDAALVAGLIFAFTPYRIEHIAHLQMLMWGWLPVSLWALHRYWSTGAFRFLVGSGTAYVLMSLSNIYLMYFGLLPLAAVAITGLARAGPPLRRMLAHAAAVMALVLAVLAPVIRPYYRVRQDNGLVRPPDEILRFSAAVEDYTRGHALVWIWRRMGGGSGEHELFPGALPVLLSIVAVATRLRKEPNVRLYAGIAVVAFVLSLGPIPTGWGHRLPVSGPYDWLLRIVPGLDGIRSVARLDAIVVLALAGLAAFGAVVVVDGVRESRQRLVTGVLAALILFEGWSAPIRVAHFDPAGDPADRDAYTYLAQGPGGAVLELPLSLADPARQLTYQYMTLIHHHPIVNGYSGYQTPLLGFVDGTHSPSIERKSLAPVIEMLRGIGVRYVTVHPDAFEDPELRDAWMRALESDHVQVSTERQFNRTIVFGLAPADDALAPPKSPESSGLRLVLSSSIRPRVSHAPERLSFLFDGDPDSRWLTNAHQSGNEWIELELDRPRDIRRVRLQMAERSLGDYPRELAIDVIEAGQTRAVFQGSVLPQFAHGLMADGKYPFIDLALPANRSQGVRLRQLGTTQTFFWSIHELQLWER